MAQPEVVGALMPAVLGKWESLRDDERALIPCTECLSALVGALGPQFLPFVEPLYGRIMRLVHARTAALATPELEEPDFDWPCVSLDLLSAMLESFGPQMAPLLESSGGVALIVQVIPTPLHVLGRISPIFSPFFSVFCAFSPSRRGGSNEPQAGAQGQETVASAPKHRFAGLANSGCWERMGGRTMAMHSIAMTILSRILEKEV